MGHKCFSKDLIDNILARVDIVEVMVDAGLELEKHTVKGEFVALCPFHDEVTPSFTVTQAKQFFKCFGCGSGGNAICFLMSYKHWRYKTSVVYLAKMAQVPLSSGRKRKKRHGRNKKWKPKKIQ